MVRCVTSFPNLLGEGPCWSVADQKLYWLDVRKPALYAYTPAGDRIESWDLPENTGCLAPRARGGLVLAMLKRFVFWKPGSEIFENAATLGPEYDGFRFNDGKCDPAGRFLAGNLKEVSRVRDGQVVDVAEREPVGDIFALDPDLSCRRITGGFTTPNGFVWSPDGGTLYLADSPLKTIFAYRYDLERGLASDRRVFVRTEAGVPDGAAIDADGCIWSACYGAGRIARYTPDGKVDRTIDLPAQQPTSVAFGGHDLGTLFVTSATQRLSPEQLAAQPEAGRLFAVDAGVKGMPEPAFAG